MIGISNNIKESMARAEQVIQITENSFRSAAIKCVSLFEKKTKKKRKDEIAINVG